jgi:hypothetical protein
MSPFSFLLLLRDSCVESSSMMVGEESREQAAKELKNRVRRTQRDQFEKYDPSGKYVGLLCELGMRQVQFLYD